MRDRPHLVAAVVLMSFVVALALQRDEAPGDVATQRPERVRLTSLVASERDRVDRLRTVVAELREQVAASTSLGTGVGGPLADSLADARGRAGLVAVEGPGVIVELDDASEAVAALDPESETNLNDYIIHSQDVRAVANALWAAGAEAMAVNGERAIPTTALLCVGNTLLINGTVHAPPYRFTVIGDPDDVSEQFDDDVLVQRFRSDARRFGLGFNMRRVDRVEIPEYRGSTGLRHAAPG